VIILEKILNFHLQIKHAMKKLRLLYIIPVILFATILFATDFNEYSEENNTNTLSQVVESTEDFDQMMSALTHPRCLNCHPSDNKPKQGIEAHPHYFGVERGKADHGFVSTNCNTCHQEENNDFSGVPGAPHWGLAPASMNWEGLSKTEIATSMMDKSRNGGKTPKEILEHLTKDPLVLWAWNPGIDAAGNPRETPPISKEAYIAAVKGWFEGVR